MLKIGDKVVMHTCLEAETWRKIWTCRTSEFTAASGDQVVFLEGYRGYFCCEFLQKVNI